MHVKTLSYFRAITSDCSSFGERVRAIQREGISGGRAVLMARKISTPQQFRNWLRRERAHDHEEKRRRRALEREAA